MKKELFVEIEIPEGIEVTFEDGFFKSKGPEGEIERKFNLGKLKTEISKNKIKIGNNKSTKNDKKRMNTIAAHIKNMIKGVQEKFEYKLKICFGHFPLNVKQEGNKVIIKNFLGEKINREVNIPKGAEVDIGKEIITIKSVNKEIAGQTAANFEAATKIGGRDKRIFQDGVYIINKSGKKI
jgi:large subunit ribosomal protein L6